MDELVTPHTLVATPPAFAQLVHGARALEEHIATLERLSQESEQVAYETIERAEEKASEIIAAAHEEADRIVAAARGSVEQLLSMIEQRMIDMRFDVATLEAALGEGGGSPEDDVGIDLVVIDLTGSERIAT